MSTDGVDQAAQTEGVYREVVKKEYGWKCVYFRTLGPYDGGHGFLEDILLDLSSYQGWTVRGHVGDGSHGATQLRIRGEWRVSSRCKGRYASG